MTWGQHSKKLPLKWIILVEGYLEANLYVLDRNFWIPNLLAEWNPSSSDLMSPNAKVTAKNTNREDKLQDSFQVALVLTVSTKTKLWSWTVSMPGPSLIIISIFLWALCLEDQDFLKNEVLLYQTFSSLQRLMIQIPELGLRKTLLKLTPRKLLHEDPLCQVSRCLSPSPKLISFADVLFTSSCYGILFWSLLFNTAQRGGEEAGCGATWD